ERPFEVRATLQEKERGLAPRCPECGGQDVRRVYSPVMVLGTGNGKHASAVEGSKAHSSGCSCGGTCGCCGH
ncbi:MAG: hypothetical protein AB1609_22505, partial [Bacillota bacterium]